ncbi:MAG: helicase-related protein [Myxococcaceae bacterium]
MSKLVVGMKVRYLPQPEWGVGHLVAFEDEGTKAQVLFPAREGGPVLVSTKQGALVAAPFNLGDPVRTSKGQSGVITGEEEGARGLRRYVVKLDGIAEPDEWPESELRATPPKPDALSMLKEGRVADADGFLLRRSALKLDDERRCDALGALFASRVMVKPHQVGVVQRVLSSRRPRFVLADEVGLGKTIEAGMVFSALRLAGLANRVLVVTPSHLTVQWLGELFHKFNQLFTLLDTERIESSLKEQPDVSPWARFDKVVTSLELLSRTEKHREDAGAPSAYWDLVIIDEAHHLKGERAFQAASALAANSWGLLLLTATPMQLDPAESRGLLTLIDPQTAPTLEGFQERLAKQEELSSAVRQLLEGKKATDLAKRFPQDEKLKSLKDPQALLAHLAETYSLSERLIRNRRAVVGGFSSRQLVRHSVALTEPEKHVREQALEKLRNERSFQGAALTNLLRRLESSPAAFVEAIKGTATLSSLTNDLKLPPRDSKYAAFLSVLQNIWKAEPTAKILVFTEARATLESLRKELSADRIEALAYHGDLALVDRDRQVARFRDPDGPKVLICTEVGGEGRNFQFSHHLVNYDLPWSPATMEQRIGRLDRIGQTQPVRIHVFDPHGTLASYVLALLADAVGVFGETVGGLDAVLEEVEAKIAELALTSPKDREAYGDALAKKVQRARESVRRAYDPLLDLRSFDEDAVRALVGRAQERLALEGEEGESLEDGLWAIARDLDERLEDAVTSLARKVGIGVDTDEQVEAFQCAFHLGRDLKVEALPGLDLHDDKTVLGTFWRDSAVEQEEIEYFATGHSIVEALFGFLRDGPYGRNGGRFIQNRGASKTTGIEVLCHLVPPEPEDTSVGAKVPSRQLTRFVDRWLVHVAVVEGPNGVPRVDEGLLPALETPGQSLKGDALLSAFPSLPSFVEPAVAAATTAAEAERRKIVERASAAVEAERDAALKRLELSLTHQGLPEATRSAQLEAERSHYDALLKAAAGIKVSVDSAAAFIIDR